MDIALITYNNGFNRILKRLNTFSDYKYANYEATGEDILDFSDVNFNPNDGLNTEIVIGTRKPLDWLDHGPDYAILHEEDDVISRWFITGIKRERQGQYRIGLRRDVLAEYKENVLSAPCYVEKGTIRDVKDPLLFNAEGMSFNQIKKNQIPLKDQSEMAWLVGYLAKNADSAAVKTISYTYPDTSDYDMTDSEIDFGDCIDYNDINGAQVSARTKTAVLVNNEDSYFRYRAVAAVSYLGNLYYQMAYNLNGEYTHAERQFNHDDWEGINSIAMRMDPESSGHELGSLEFTGWCDDWNAYLNGEKPAVTNAWNNMRNSLISNNLGNTSGIVDSDLKQYDGKRILHNGRVYQLTIGYTIKTKDAYINCNNAYFNAFCDSLREERFYGVNTRWFASQDTVEPLKNKAKISINYLEYSIVATEIHVDDEFTFTLPGVPARNACALAQYDMFAIPVTAAGLGFSVDGDDQKDCDFQITVQEDGDDVVKHARINAISGNNLLIAQLLCTTLSDYVYDLQLLPYCPVEFVYFNGSNYTTHNFLNGATNACYLDEMDPRDYSAVFTNGGDLAGVIFWPKNPMFTKYLDIKLPNEHESREPYTIKEPTFVYNNSTHLGDPIWRLEFPYKATGALSTSDVVIPSQIDANWMTLSYNGSNGHPCIYLTSDQLPQDPTASQQETLRGMEISLTANWVLPDTAEMLKVQNECEFQRMVSPNFSGMFEFKKCKMAGGVHNINVDCYYKPYQPYIKLNPDFSFLYGRDFNDSTGLILGGDFSLPKMKDAFIDYELQNKNYQAIFARNIENMDVNNEIAREKQLINGLMGVVGSGMGGAVAGSLMSKAHPVAGALAGLGGAAMAGISTVVNDNLMQRQQAENRDFAIDNFNYSLGNIKAMPQSITKSTPLTYNTTMWPVIEEYDATDEEKELLKNKLKYDGMTIMKVATLGEYESEGGYLKGKIIRLNIDANSQVANQIYQEVDKGFYTE